MSNDHIWQLCEKCTVFMYGLWAYGKKDKGLGFLKLKGSVRCEPALVQLDGAMSIYQKWTFQLYQRATVRVARLYTFGCGIAQHRSILQLF